MKLNIRKFRRALLLNHPKLPMRLVPDIIFKLTRTPKFGGRARNIIYALNYIHVHMQKSRCKLDQIAEFGVAAGEGSRQLVILVLHFCRLYGLKPPKFYGFDSFEGMHPSENPADSGTWAVGDYEGDYEALKDFIIEAGWVDRCEFIKGYFRETLAKTPETFAPDFVLIDSDYYTSARDVFESLKDRLPTGTVIFFDDLGTNFYNRLMGEERLIDEVNKGLLGDPYHLHHLWDRCFVWSNANKPVLKTVQSKLDIPLRRNTKLENFY